MKQPKFFKIRTTLIRVDLITRMDKYSGGTDGSNKEIHMIAIEFDGLSRLTMRVENYSQYDELENLLLSIGTDNE